ncbi:hypothetical protein E5288_WYG007475 [Bos mutus]|uniref:Uncharacterized protein n=1 Tax=Bos mutus TaxID=72004 RepID=A0A6B0RCG7_9CETA|nr:hypothetical protein [Bos mutus]
MRPPATPTASTMHTGRRPAIVNRRFPVAPQVGARISTSHRSRKDVYLMLLEVGDTYSLSPWGAWLTKQGSLQKDVDFIAWPPPSPDTMPMSPAEFGIFLLTEAQREPWLMPAAKGDDPAPCQPQLLKCECPPCSPSRTAGQNSTTATSLTPVEPTVARGDAVPRLRGRL